MIEPYQRAVHGDGHSACEILLRFFLATARFTSSERETRVDAPGTATAKMKGYANDPVL